MPLGCRAHFWTVWSQFFSLFLFQFLIHAFQLPQTADHPLCAKPLLCGFGSYSSLFLNCIRVLQRNRTDRIYKNISKESYYGLAHLIIEAVSPDLPFASWAEGINTGGVVPVQTLKPEKPGRWSKSQCKPKYSRTCLSTGEVGFPGLRREHIHPFSAFLFCSGPQPFEWCSPTLIKAIFTQFTNSYPSLCQKLYFTIYLGIP